MTCLLAAESVLYSPAPPTKCALRRHSQLQRFAWAEAEAPAVAAARALPGEPLFCFETCLKACYLCLHSYRHFRVRLGGPAAGVGEQEGTVPGVQPGLCRTRRLLTDQPPCFACCTSSA